MFLLTAKPVVYLINLSEKDFKRKKNKHLASIHNWLKDTHGDLPFSVQLVSAQFEEKLTLQANEAAENEQPESDELKEEKKLSALPPIIKKMRTALDLSSFFTTGEDEVRQWTIRKGIKAPAAAGVIHTDFEKTFIQAIAYNYSALQEYGNEGGVKAAGKIMTKGKDYVVEDGDILLIKAGAAKS